MSKNRYLYEDIRDAKEAYNKLALVILEKLEKVFIPILHILTRLLRFGGGK